MKQTFLTKKKMNSIGPWTAKWNRGTVFSRFLYYTLIDLDISLPYYIVTQNKWTRFFEYFIILSCV